MTLPFERKNAVLTTREFLLNLCDASKTPKIPKQIRQQAGSLLKHYPAKHDMDTAGEQVPNIFGDDDLKVLTQRNKSV